MRGLVCWLAVLVGGASYGGAQMGAATATGTARGTETGNGIAAKAGTFANPLLENGPDPWVVWWKGFYYYSNTTGRNLTLRKTADITDLRDAEVKALWTPEPGKAWSKDLWAPELHRWGKKWFIYFTADAAENSTHRVYVVENDHDDPMVGEWTFDGKVSDATDLWAIDPTIEWEKHGDLPGRHVDVNEGPEFLAHGKKMFIVYSASACWTDFYSLGAVEADVHADPLDAKSWTKIDHPLLSTDAEAHAFSPGHNGFFKSPDGKQDWIIYHANPGPGEGCDGRRSPRIQKFTWGKDGLPDFGKPVAVGETLEKPGQ